MAFIPKMVCYFAAHWWFYILHPCIDILPSSTIYIFFALSPLGLQPGRPGGYLYRLRRNKIMYALCVIWSHFSNDQFLCQKGGIGKSYTGTPVSSASCHSMNQASSVGSKVYPQMFSVCGTPWPLFKYMLPT